MRTVDLLSCGCERVLQVLSKLGTGLWQDVVGSYQARHAAGLQAAAGNLLTLLTDMDQLLSTHRCPPPPACVTGGGT